MKKPKISFLLIILVILSFIPLFDLLHVGLPVTHDGQDHVARIANFYKNLTDGNIIPRWAPDLNWGYGHPILMFLYPLPSYFASFFHFAGFNLVDSIKIVFGFSFVLSGLTMFIFIKELLRSEKSAFLGSLLYIIAPYRFVDLYVRGAIGEHVAFVFLPLILYFILKTSKQSKFPYIIGGSFSLAGLILSHNAMTLMLFPIIIFYGVFLFFQSKNHNSYILNLASIILLGFGLSSFFIVPAFFEGKYTLRDIVTGGGEYKTSFVPIKDFFFGQWDYGGTLTLSKQVGFLHWVGTLGSIFSIYILHKKKKKLWIVGLMSFVIFWVTLFLMTSGSDFIWASVTLLQKFQFPWRFLSLTVFLSALLGAVAFNGFPDKFKKILLITSVLILLVVNKDYWHANGFLNKSESFYSGIYEGTTDTGESAPIWSVRFMEKKPNENVDVILGKAEIKEIKRTSTQHIYNIEANEKVRIRENTLYFPGWNVLVDGKKTEIEFQDQKNRGLITFYLENGEHLVNVKFEETKLRLFSDIASIVSLLMIVFLSIIKK